MAKKVLVINGSPNGSRGNTEVIVNAFVEGLEAEGASVKRLYTRDLKIGPCCGTLHCWTQTPGVCAKKDDMRIVLQEMEDADILVLASPVYSDGITGQLKNLLDRCLVRVKPYQVFQEGHCRHISRSRRGFKQLVLVSNCGFHEMDNFDAMLAHMRARCRNFHCDLAGALLRPHGPALKVLLDRIPAKVSLHQRALDVLVAAKRAGQELATTGKMSEEALEDISRELLSSRQYQALINGHFGLAIAKMKTTKTVGMLKAAIGC